MPSSVWPTLRRQLRADLPAEDFRTWFHPLRVASEDADHLVLEAPNSRFVEALEEGFRPIVDWAIADLKGPTYQVLFKSGEARTRVETPGKISPRQARRETARRQLAPTRRGRQAVRSTPSTGSTRSSSATRTASPAPPPRPSPRSPASRTTRSSSTAAWAWARPISCMRSETASSGRHRVRESCTSPPRTSSTT